MTLAELEIRVATLEQNLAHLASKVGGPAPTEMNAWIDQIRGTFQDDATYRQAARLGRQWRKSLRESVKPRTRKTTGK